MYPSLSLALPFQLALPSWLMRLAYVFEDDDKGGGDDDRDDDAFSDDLDSAFGDDTDDDTDDDKDDDDEDDDMDKDKSKSKKSDSSAIHQKKRYRDKLKAATDRIRQLESKDKDGKLTEEDKKEQAAKKFLADTIRDVLKQIESEQSESERERQDTFATELEEVLDENPKVKEDDLLKVAEELGVSPKQALKILEREKKLTKREKPKVPKEKRASTEVDTTKQGGGKERLTLDSINRRIKEGIQKGNY